MLKKLKLAVCTALAIPLIAAMSSCSSEEEITPPVNNEIASLSEFKTQYNSYFDRVSNIPVYGLGDGSPLFSRSNPWDYKADIDTLYIKLPQHDLPQEEIGYFAGQVTFGELMKLSKEFNGKFTTDVSDGYDIAVVMSNSEAKEALAPMHETSMNYLSKKGLSQTEIHDLMVETGLEESDIIPFVLLCSEIETLREEYRVDNGFTNYAFMDDPDQQNAFISMDGVIKCALEAIGYTVIKDFVAALAGQTLTKVVLINTFKIVAKKYAGWVGTALIALEFGHCLVVNW